MKKLDVKLLIPLPSAVADEIKRRAMLEGIPFTIYARRLIYQALYGDNWAVEITAITNETKGKDHE